MIRFALLSCLLVLTACESPLIQQQIDMRNAMIAQEPRGDYFIGRRFRIERTHFWGYLRRPGQTWVKAQLVVVSERSKEQPDRLPEEPSDASNAYGYDHNWEYKVQGRFTGRKIYDPNSDLILPEFEATSYELINSTAGWLFKPNEKFNGYQLLRAEPTAMP